MPRNRWHRDVRVMIKQGVVSVLLLIGLIPGFAFADTETAPVPANLAALQRGLDGVMNQQALQSAWVGVRVETMAGDVLYDYNGSKLFMPASNMKLLSAAAGLELLGPDYRWHTNVLATPWEGDPAFLADDPNGPLPAVLPGNLYLQGGGDPTLLQEDLQRISRNLYARGVREVAGDLVYDPSFFDDVLWAPGWEWDYRDFYYAAPVTGLSLSPDRDYDANTIKISVYPGAEVFGPARVAIEPSLGVLNIVNETRTSGTTAAGAISAYWNSDGALVVSGHTPHNKPPATMWLSLQDPVPFVASVFAGALRQAGITVRGDVVRGSVPVRQNTLYTHSSMRLAQLLVPFMKLSNNGHGEVILKSLGRQFRSQGTWSAGRAMIETFLQDVVRVQGPFVIADGSGLGRKNHVSPAQLTAVLRYMADRPNYRTFLSSLPIAGAPDRMVGGTLRSRLGGTTAQYKTFAKTGSLTHVSALSGYVDTASGERLVFSIMLNNAVGVSSKIIEDTIVTVLARY